MESYDLVVLTDDNFIDPPNNCREEDGLILKY